MKNRFSSFFAKFLPFLMIFQTSAMSSAHDTMQNGKTLAKNEEKPCSKFLPSKNAIKQSGQGGILKIFRVGFFSFFYRLSRKMA